MLNVVWEYIPILKTRHERILKCDVSTYEFATCVAMILLRIFHRFFLHRVVDPLRRIARPFLFCRLYSDRPADRFNCTWSLLLFGEPVLIFPCDRFARSTSVCFRVSPSLFYSYERRWYLRPHSLFQSVRQTWSPFAKNDYVDRIMSTNLKKFWAISCNWKKHKRLYIEVIILINNKKEKFFLLLCLNIYYVK